MVCVIAVMLIFHSDPQQDDAATGMEHPSHQTPHPISQPPRQTMIGRLSSPGLGLNSQNLCTPMPNFHRERSTSFSSYGPLRSFPTMALRLLQTTETFTITLIPLTLVTFAGKAPSLGTAALSLKRLGLQSGRPQYMRSGIGTLTRWLRTYWLLQTSTAISTMRHTKNLAMRSNSIVILCLVIGHGGNRYLFHLDTILMSLRVSLFRTLSLRTPQRTVPCLFQSSWGLTKRQSLSPPARMISTPYTFRLGMSRTIFGARTRMHLFYLGFSQYQKVSIPLLQFPSNISASHDRCQEGHRHGGVSKLQEGPNT